jgi:hypothetical protein
MSFVYRVCTGYIPFSTVKYRNFREIRLGERIDKAPKFYDVYLGTSDSCLLNYVGGYERVLEVPGHWKSQARGMWHQSSLSVEISNAEIGTGTYLLY